MRDQKELEYQVNYAKNQEQRELEFYRPELDAEVGARRQRPKSPSHDE